MPVASSSTTVFTEADFDRLSWHDNPVYGLFVDNDVSVWKSDLVFDIDFIVEWRIADFHSDASTRWPDTATSCAHRLPSPQRGRGAGG